MSIVGDSLLEPFWPGITFHQDTYAILSKPFSRGHRMWPWLFKLNGCSLDVQAVVQRNSESIRHYGWKRKYLPSIVSNHRFFFKIQNHFHPDSWNHLLTDGASSNLKDGYKNYTIDPSTRYRNISAKIDHERILPLYDSGIRIWSSILSMYIKVTVCTYVPFSRPNRQTNLHQILRRPPHQLGEGS